MKDAKISEIHEQTQKEKEKYESNTLRNIPQRIKILLLVGLGIGIYAWKVLEYNPKNIIITLALLFVASLLLYGGSDERRNLTEQEIKVKLLKVLQFKQIHPLGRHSEVPQGEIKVGPVCKLQFSEGKPLKWHVGFRILDSTTTLEKLYKSELSVYGDITSIQELM